MENNKWYIIILCPLILVYALIFFGVTTNPTKTFIIIFLVLKIAAIWFMIEAKNARNLSLTLKH